MTDETKATPKQRAAGRDGAIIVGVSALMAMHPNPIALRTVLERLAAASRAQAFDEPDEVDFVRDAYDDAIGMLINSIDATAVRIDKMAAETATTTN
jgi:hypothetical protein